MRSNRSSPSPPWQVLVLVSNHLDPKTLASASCVSKSWSLCMSSDSLWEPICASRFPTLSPLRLLSGSSAPLPWCKLYALGRTSAMLRHRQCPPPRLSLENLIFTVEVRTCSTHHVLATVKPGSELGSDSRGVFWFEFDVARGQEKMLSSFDGLEVTWNVVLEGFKGVFTMMDCKGKGKLLGGVDWWFSEELPSRSCCCCDGWGGGGSGLVADLRLGLRGSEGGGKWIVDRIGLGVMSIASWRYVCRDDAIRFLQHFLMPCNRSI